MTAKPLLFSVRRPALLAAGVIALLALGGCAHKIWPEAQATEDRFSLAEVDGGRDGACLTVEARIKGAVSRLSHLSILLDEVTEGCPDCPFVPDRMEDYYPGGQDMRLTGDYARMEYCELDPGGSYKWRLVGHNRFPSIRPVVSDVSTTTPKD